MVRRFLLLACLLILATIGEFERSARANTLDSADTPDPFVLLHGGRYYAFSTSASVRRCNGTNASMYLPHRSTTNLKNWGSPSCFSDALPNGPSPWAQNTKSIWAPTVYRNADNGQFVMLYSADADKRTGFERYCIGRATSPTPGGPYTADPSPYPLICPGNGRDWALDPNVWVSPDSKNVFVQWRQDVSPTESRLVGAQFSRDGKTRLSSVRLLLSETDVSWDGGVVIENPAIQKRNGVFYLYYSGNRYDSNDYATGVAACGSKLISGGKCTPLYGTSRPWIGWSGRPGGTLTTLPHNRPGPGGMSFISRSSGGIVGASDGSPYIAIHWWSVYVARLRPMELFKIVYSPYGPYPANF